MRSYKEYYTLAIKQENDWYYNQTDAWWRYDENTRLSFVTKGDYIETANMVSVASKIDVPVFTNHTNLKNSEWSRLHFILSQALIDWLNKNKKDNLYSFTFKLFRGVDCIDNIYEIEYSAQKLEDEYPVDINDPELQECADFLCDLVAEFIESHLNDIPLDWNSLSFYIDSLEHSCKCNGWCAYSDSYLNIGNVDFENEYTSYVLSI